MRKRLMILTGALLLPACNEKPPVEFNVRPAEAICPAPPVPPAELLKRPPALDFLQYLGIKPKP